MSDRHDSQSSTIPVPADSATESMTVALFDTHSWTRLGFLPPKSLPWIRQYDSSASALLSQVLALRLCIQAPQV